MFVLDPIFRIFDACMNFKKDAIMPMLEKLEIQLKSDEKELEGKALLKVSKLAHYPRIVPDPLFADHHEEVFACW
jgi:hypothetical protein